MTRLFRLNDREAAFPQRQGLADLKDSFVPKVGSSVQFIALQQEPSCYNSGPYVYLRRCLIDGFSFLPLPTSKALEPAMIPLLITTLTTIRLHSLRLMLDKPNGLKSSPLSQTSGFSRDLNSLLWPLSAPVPLAHPSVLFAPQLHAVLHVQAAFLLSTLTAQQL